MSVQTFTATSTIEWTTYEYVTTQDRLVLKNNSNNDLDIEVGVFTNVVLHAQ